MKKTDLFPLICFQKILKKSEKFLFVLITVFFISATSSFAQNYMDFDNAATTLKNEIVQKSNQISATSSANQQNANEGAILIFYRMMLTNLEDTKDVKAAIEATFVKPNYTGQKKIVADQAKDRIKTLLVQ